MNAERIVSEIKCHFIYPNDHSDRFLVEIGISIESADITTLHWVISQWQRCLKPYDDNPGVQ